MTRGIGGLRRSLVGAIGTAIGALILALMLLEDPLVQYRLRELAKQTLQAAIDATADALDDGEEAERAARTTAARFGCRIQIFAADGAPVADSASAQLEDTHLSEAEPGVAIRVEGGHRMSGRHDGGLIVQAWRPAGDVDRLHATVRELLVIGGVMALLVAIALTIVLGRALVEPARELTEVADALAAGDLSARAESDRDDELGAIGRALDRMAEQLVERIERLRAEQDRLRTVLNSMVEAVFVTDSLGRIEQTNDALDALVGSDASGKTPLEAIGNEALHEAVRRARRGGAQDVEIRIERPEETLTLRAVVASLPEDAGVVAVLHDVSALAEAARIRRDFVANASHELRTPLTAIRGFAETLRDGAIDDPEASRRFLDVIMRHALRLQALAEDMTALARAEAVGADPTLAPVDVEKAVRDAAHGLERHAEALDTTLTLELEEDLFALANPRSLDQVLVNLIDNAVKYSPPGATVTVRTRRVSGFGLDSVTQAPGKGDAAVIEVHNTGTGIAREHLARIFERFYRVDTGRSREVGGTGLGLAIVKHLCTSMKGSVTASSPEGGGVLFTVRLRAADHAPASDDAAPTPVE